MLVYSSRYYGVGKEEGSSGVGEALLDQIKKMMAESLIGENRSNKAKGRRLGIRYISPMETRGTIPWHLMVSVTIRPMSTTVAVIPLTQAGAELEGSEKSPTVWLKTWAATK
ncbi:unnamed protein product [Microthlaspi erraticum]|uniref:Uncharacterized protein n=1 Tax=Microthlaspi erraticum TaxID=1685480 RepID=A0A6D2HTC5_9BRAS|nr:unnamed protein product [Microthlaspi erraticum]